MKFTFSILLVILTVPALRADDWPHWRGPNRNGVAAEKEWLDRWPADGPPVVWKGSVGTGYSSLSVSQGRLYTMGHKDGQDAVHCLDALTGKPIWKHSYMADLGDLYFEGGPTSTPTVHEGSVFTLSRWGDLFCFDAANGNIRWSRQLQKDDELRVPGWGFSCSPVVHGKLLLLNVGKAGMALEKDTGNVVWKSANEEAGYSTPVLYRRGDDWFAIVSYGNAFASVNVATGKRLWEVRWITRYGVNSADPIIDGDYLFLSSGYDKGGAVLKMGNGEPVEVWRNKNLRNQFNSSVLLDGLLYGIDGDTTGTPALKCVEFKTGEVRWKDESIGSGALMAANGKLIVLSESGELIVAPASGDGFKPSARAKLLDAKCWTVPVLANGRIYCRNETGDLVCVDVRPNR